MKRRLFLVSLLPAFILFTSFIKDKSQLKDEDTVPPELGKEATTILLLETPRNKVNRDMVEAFEKHFSGTVELIPETMLYSGQYKDSKKYRYYLTTSIKFVDAKGWGNTRQPATYEYSYGITDRQTSNHYGTSNASDAWLSLLKRYIKKMEEVWKSNQPK
jgi:hypothetical protein